MEKIIYDFYSDLFDSHAYLPPHHLRKDGHTIPEECKVPKQWRTTKTVLLYQKGDRHDIGNYRPICLLSVIYKLFTRVILNRIEKVLDEGQPCEQAGIRKGFSTIDNIHTVLKLIEVSREYKMLLCLTIIDLKKAFDSVVTEAVVEALNKQGVPTQYIKNQPSGANADRIRRNMWMHRSSAESTKDVVHVERMSLGCPIHAQWNEHIRMHQLRLSGIDDVVKKTRNTQLRAHLFNTTVLPALTYAWETWAFRKQEENAVSVIERAIERVILSRFTQVRDGIRSSLLRQRSKIRDSAAFAKESKIRWVGHVMGINDNRWTRAVSDWVLRDIKRTTGRPPTRWSDLFTKSFKEKYDALRVPRERRNHSATLARDRDKWKNYWRPLDQFEDQQESR
ncbi:hypothetical protein RB195_025040 [Necator americanus]|uniref:Reverse transcriptase domain-containing protein n=1 Tax=Necator americanus TaxID=51031 RepID=A0ABR1EQL7_NECAM